MSTYVMSDIHGCYNEFNRMLDKIGFSENDKLYLAGDYIDRGKDSLGMLKWLENCPSNVFPIRGNHDVEFAENINLMKKVDKVNDLNTDFDSNEDTQILFETVRYLLKEKGEVALKFYDYYGTISKLLTEDKATMNDFIKWQKMILDYPYYYRFQLNNRTVIIVHAGYVESLDDAGGRFENIEEFYMYAREESIQIGGVKKGMVIAGHTPTITKKMFSYNDGEVFRYYDIEKDCIFYDIDCGCAYYEVDPSATLACIRLEDEEIFYL